MVTPESASGMPPLIITQNSYRCIDDANNPYGVPKRVKTLRQVLHRLCFSLITPVCLPTKQLRFFFLDMFWHSLGISHCQLYGRLSPINSSASSRLHTPECKRPHLTPCLRITRLLRPAIIIITTMLHGTLSALLRFCACEVGLGNNAS